MSNLLDQLRGEPASAKEYPALTLQKGIIFPNTVVPLLLEGKEAVETLRKSVSGDHMIVMDTVKDNGTSPVGVLSRVLQFWNLTPEVMGATVEGIRRVKIEHLSTEGDIRKARVSEIIQSTKNSNEIEALSRSVAHQFNQLLKVQGTLSSETLSSLQEEESTPEKVADVVSSALRLSFGERVKLLETIDLRTRLNLLSSRLAKELSIAETEQSIQKKVTEEVGKVQREYMLREQLKAIEKELGVEEGHKAFDDLEARLKAAKMPKETEDRVLKELNRLRRMPESNPEASYITAYLDTVADLPWGKKTASTIDLKKAETTLNHDHYGLDKVKERILEYLAVQKLSGGKSKGNILNFVGPPGTGKTSVGQSIAKALGRNFVRMSLGGIHDESEIRGHRRTYVGAMPGRIIQGIRNAKSKNPVFMLDEVDKVGADYRGDPTAALLEVLDPAQNNTFSDNYLEVPFDLSDVLFITTANVLDTIPPPLRDRMEIIEFTSYTNEEKLHIAKQFLLPKVVAKTGLTKEQFSITDAALQHIIARHTKEAGVRELERKIDQIARKVARLIVEHKIDQRVFDIADIERFLGPEEYEETIKEAEDEVGISTGLAWTPVGGEIIFIETAVVPGRRSLMLTGQLGNVMKESAEAALTYVRSQNEKLKFDPVLYQNSDIHIHIPAGAIPKDGPSAGVAIATSLASALTKRKVKRDVAMTGEITLRGKVLPVDGIREKVVAAYRAGITTVILPADNRANLSEIPDEAREKMTFHFIETADEAFKIALM